MTALGFPGAYYERLRADYQARRDLLYDGLIAIAGFVAYKPRGAYYILTDVAHFMARTGCADDTAFAMYLVKDIGVTTVPGSSFYAHQELGRTKDPVLLPQDRRHADRGGEAVAEARGLTLRAQARAIFDAGIAAGDVRPLVIRALGGLPLPERGRVLVVRGGKACGAKRRLLVQAHHRRWSARP